MGKRKGGRKDGLDFESRGAATVVSEEVNEMPLSSWDIYRFYDFEAGTWTR